MSENLVYPTTVRHQKWVIAFALRQGSNTVCYNVLDLQVGSRNDALDWTGFTALAMPPVLSPAGISLLDATLAPAVTGQAASAPFQVVSDGQYVYLFQPSTQGTLYVSTFVLTQLAAERGTEAPLPILEPAWEVRYKRSGGRDLEAEDGDSQGYLAADGTPFLRPTIELSMIRHAANGRFGVALTPANIPAQARWQIFTVDPDQRHIELYTLLFSAERVVDLSDLVPESSGSYAPTARFALDLVDGAGNAGVPLVLATGPSAVFFNNQEASTDSNVLLKRNGRLMLALGTECATPAGRPTALLEFSVAADGTLAQPTAVVQVSAVDPLDYALSFKAQGHATLAKTSLKPALFTLQAWVYPTDVTPEQSWLIGGAENLADQAQPAFLKLLSGGYVVGGFGTGEALCAVQTQIRLRTGRWYQLALTFDGSSLKLYVNADLQPTTAIGIDPAGQAPADQPIRLFGRQQGGFLGVVDEIAVWDVALAAAQIHQSLYRRLQPAPNLIGYWPMNAGQGSTIEDASGHGNPGTLSGPAWIPSDSPVEPARVPQVHVDARGLTLEAGVLPWLETADAPFLMNGADGLIHLYFRSLGNLFSVAQYSTRSARALFIAPWTAGAGSAGAQAGYVQFLARRSGSALNDASITLAGAADSVLADVAFGEDGQDWERWRGVPRQANRFIEILQGRAQTDPTASAVQNGTVAFYDYDGALAQARLPIDVQTGSNIAFVSGLISRSQAPLAAVRIAAAGAQRDLVFEFRFKDSVDGAPVIRQTWPALPASVGELTTVLRGFSPSYDYAAVRPDDTPVYALQTADGALLLIGRPGSVTTLAAGVEPDSEAGSAWCKVLLTLNPATAPVQISFARVPRSESTFASVLLGNDPDYDYTTLASPNYREVALQVAVIANGRSGDVADQQLGAEQTASLLASTALVAIVAEGVLPGVTLPVPPQPLAASVLQGIVVDPPEPLPHGAPGYLLRNIGAGMLRQRPPRRVAASATTTSGPRPATFFNVLPVTLPSNGYPGLLAVPASAALYQAGRLGGWLIEPQRYALAFDGGNRVEVDSTTLRFDPLFLRQALTVEAFVHLQPPASTSSGTRVLTANAERGSGAQAQVARYMLGLEPSHYLQVANTAYVRTLPGTRMVLADQALTLQLWLRPLLGSIPAGRSGLVYGLFTSTIQESLSVTPDGSLSYVVGDTTIELATPLPDNAWTQLSVVRAGTSVRVLLDGRDIGGGTVAVLPAELQALYLCHPLGLWEVGFNDLRLWTRALGAAEIAGNWRRRVSPDADGLLILWSLSQSTGRAVPNSAASGSAYDGEVPAGNPLWDRPGVYYALYGGAGSRLLRSTAVVPRQAWVQTALVYRSGCGLQFRGSDFADCGSNRSLNSGDAFTASCWVQLASGAGSASEVVLGKWGVARSTWEYRLGVDAAGRPFFDVMVAGASAPFRIQHAIGIRDGRPHHLAAVLKTGMTAPTKDEQAQPQYLLTLAIYVDGVETSHTHASASQALAVQVSAIPFNFGRQWPDARGAAVGGEQLYYRGQLSNVSLWSRQLLVSEIATMAHTRAEPANRDGLVSAWLFQEMSGKVAADSSDVNNARLSSNALWILFDATSRLRLLADGVVQAQVEEIDASAVGGWGIAQFSIGALRSSASSATQGFTGQLDEIRVWNRDLTDEQISDSQYRSLSGAEPGLAGYWSFDGNSGTTAYDLTVNGNDGLLQPAAAPPAWTLSTAPLSNEAPEVINVLGGVMTDRVLSIDGSPAATEYADLQLDAAGQPFSVMKRAYAAPTAGAIALLSGFKVGDLQTRHLGQVQTEPTLIGYIEGAPPLPSENMTRPLYLSPTSSDYVSYGSSASITLQQSSEIRYTFAAVKETGFDLSTDIRAGLFFNNEVSAGSPFLMAETTSLDGHVGAHGVIEFGTSTSSGQGNGIGRVAVLSDQVVSGGEWEPQAEAEWLNPAVGRRFVPSSFGYAVVKSLTADLYASYLQGTGTLVALTTVPSPDIPEDVNVISFPMNPEYVAGGCLDGKVGFVQAPNFKPGSKQQSYFKPIEAYRLKRQVERQTEQAAAYYQQFDAGARGKGGDASLERQRDADPYYQWTTQVPRRSIVNTYAWTAGGGLHAEEENFTVSRTEDYSGKYQFSGKGGIDARAEAAFFVGFYLEFDFLIGGHTEITVSKGAQDSRFFGMNVELGADRFLKRWLGNPPPPDVPSCDGYSVTNGPGKVRGYRFMSFYLAPDSANAEQFNAVIDQNWLRNSGDPNAAALAAATGSGNGVWRVLHRTTFVNRVPPEYQTTPDQSLAPPVREPANQPANSEIIELVRRAVTTISAGQPPTAADIGAAVTVVIGPAAAGAPAPVLDSVLPWWPAFLASAAEFGTPAQAAYTRFRADLLAYMLNLYATEALR